MISTVFEIQLSVKNILLFFINLLFLSFLKDLYNLSFSEIIRFRKSFTKSLPEPQISS